MITTYKYIGETPLQVVERMRVAHNIAKDVKMAYAGRLDPMAQGVMIILVGDECLTRREYELLEKEYEFEMLCGVETDTYDVMGIVQNQKVAAKSDHLQKNEVDEVLNSYVGHFEQSYPPYSAPRVNGHPLYWWAREGRLAEIDIPTHKVHIYSAQMFAKRTITAQEVVAYATERIGHTTTADAFRQPAIVDSWNAWLANQPHTASLSIFSGRVVCSSGTYIRAICYEVGRKLGVGAIAYSITRTRVGDRTYPTGE